MISFFDKVWSYISLVKQSNLKTSKNKIIALKILITLYFKERLYPKSQRRITVKIFSFYVTAYRYSTILFLFKEIFLNNDYFFETKKKELKIIDCGSNIGMSILYFKWLYPNCKIMAFEPNPNAFELLKINVAQNNLQGIVVENVGLSNIKGKSSFYYLPKDFASLKGSISTERKEGKKIEVDINMLSNYMREEKFDLVKIDVEGAEALILDDLLTYKTLINSQRYIIEYHHNIGKSFPALSLFLKPFEDCGFRYNFKTNHSTLGSFQDVVFHFYK